MKKIGFVAPWYGENIPGGAEAALRGITKHLNMAGVDIEIITTTVKEFTADWNADYYKTGLSNDADGIPVRRFSVRKRDVHAFDKVNLKLMNNIALDQKEEDIYEKEMVNSPELYRYIRENKDDYELFVFIPYMFGTTYWGVQECYEKAVMIPCFHDESYIYMNNFKRVFSKVAGMLFNAQPEADLADKVYNTKNIKTQVMGLGVNTDLIYDINRFRSKFNIYDPFILYAGRKDVGKNIYTLINDFHEYKLRNKDNLKLVLIGGGEIIIPHEIRSDVYDLGFVSMQDKYDAYGAAELLCQPSKNESFSFVIMESWLSERPVLVHNDCNVTKHFVQVSNGGLYFKDYFEFEGAVQYILRNKEIADSMGKLGRQYVLDNFSWEVIVTKYIKFFETLSQK